MPKVITDDTRWDSDGNLKAFLTKECVKTITQSWLRRQTVLLIWVPLDFSRLC